MAADWKKRSKLVSDWKSRSTVVSPSPAAAAPSTPAEEPSTAGETAEAALIGFGQSASFGFSDEIAGALGAGVAAGIRALYGHGPDADEIAYRVLGAKTADEAGYEQVRDQQRKQRDEAAAKHPYAYHGAGLAGGLATPLPLAGGLGPVAKGAVSGAVSGVGASDAGPVGTAASALGGAALGGGLGYALSPARLLEASRKHLFRSIAPAAGLSNRMRQKLGIASLPEQQQLEQEVLAAKFVRPFEKSSTALARVEDALEDAGGKIGELNEKAQRVADGLEPPPPGKMRWQPSRDYQQKKVLDFLNRPTTATEEDLMGPLSHEILPRVGTDAQSYVLGPATYKELWKNKSQLQRSLKAAEHSTEAQKLYRGAVGKYTQGVYEQLGMALGKEDKQALEMAASRYGTAAKIEDLLREKASRETQHASVGLLDLQKAQLAESALGSKIPGIGPASAAFYSLWSPVADPTLTHAYRGAAGAIGGAMRATERAGLAEPQSVLTRNAGKATASAFDQLLGRFGIQATDKDQLSDEWFLKGQTDEQAQPGKER